MSKTRIFADGMETVSFTEGMIRMEFYNVAPTNKAAEKHGEHDISSELIIQPQGFLRAYKAMEELVNKLIAAGIIKRKDGEAGASSEGSPAASLEEKPSESLSASPNFE